jgi:hypothetical protein
VQYIFGLLARHEGMSVQQPSPFALTPAGRGELQVQHDGVMSIYGESDDEAERHSDVPREHLDNPEGKIAVYNSVEHHRA